VSFNWKITLTDLIAFYAALVSTSLLVFEIIKWFRSGPQVTLDIQTNMKFINVPNISGDKTFTVFKLTNNGDRATTVENIGYRYYKSGFHYWIRNHSEQAIIPTGNTCFKPLPYVLEPGTTWEGLMDETIATKNYTRKGLFVFVSHLSHQKRSITRKVYYNKGVN